MSIGTLIKFVASGDPIDLSKMFSDNGSIHDSYREAVQLFVQTGIMKGSGQLQFEPGETATRAQAGVVQIDYSRCCLFWSER